MSLDVALDVSAELDPAELPTTVRQMASIVGWKTWQRRIPEGAVKAAREQLSELDVRQPTRA